MGSNNLPIPSALGSGPESPVQRQSGAPSFSRSLREGGTFRGHEPFWQPRYDDFNAHREPKLMGKRDYMHRNPAQRGLVTGEEGAVEIESRRTACRREQPGV